MSASPTLFLLSPARLDGRRGAQLLAPTARSPLAEALRTREGAPLGEVFQFVSSLYFRGKLAYARHFADAGITPEWWGSGVLVITQNRGLVPAESRVCLEHVAAFAQTRIDTKEADYRAPLVRDATSIREHLGEGRVVLLGSVATPKYVETLLAVFGDRVFYPSSLRGMGDMRRGSVLLRAAAEDRELEYEPLSSLARPLE